MTRFVVLTLGGSINNLETCPKDIASNTVELKSILLENSTKISLDWNFDKQSFEELVNSINFDHINSSRFEDNYYLTQIMSNEAISPSLKQLIQRFNDDYLDIINEADVATGNSIINNFYSSNVSGLNEDDKPVFEYFIDVALNSNQYWKPTLEGGLNKREFGISITNELCREYYQNRWDPFKTLMADATGCFSGACANLAASGGAGAIPNPLFGGCPTAGVVGAIVGAGASINTLW